MKIRTGFVSNSSSSSFAIYGIYLDQNEVPDKLKPQSTNPNIDDENIDNDSYDFSPLDWIFSGQGGYLYIGIAPHSIGDNETGKQFKDKVKSQLNNMFGDEFMQNRECEYHYGEYEW